MHFSWSVEPMEAGEWLVQVEKNYDVLAWTECQKVSLADFMLKGAVERRWKTIWKEYENIDDSIAWDAYKKMFNKKFILAEFKSLSKEIYWWQIMNINL